MKSLGNVTICWGEPWCCGECSVPRFSLRHESEYAVQWRVPCRTLMILARRPMWAMGLSSFMCVRLPSEYSHKDQFRAFGIFSVLSICKIKYWSTVKTRSTLWEQAARPNLKLLCTIRIFVFNGIYISLSSHVLRLCVWTTYSISHMINYKSFLLL